MWGTPTARDHKDGASTLENTPVNGLLGREVLQWPTPAANAFEIADADALLKRRRECQERHGNGNGFGLTLGQTVSLMSLSSHPDPEPPPNGSESCETTRGSRPRSQKKRLNAYFVELLMGWAPNWTSPTGSAGFGPAGMALWRSRARQHLSTLLGGLD